MFDNEPLTLSKEKDVFEDQIILALILGFVCPFTKKEQYNFKLKPLFSIDLFEDFTIFVAYHG